MSEQSDTGTNAFREAEKKYQRHQKREVRLWKGKLKGGTLVTRPVDFKEVLDFSAVHQTHPLQSSKTQAVACRAFPLPDHPGFCFLHQALSIQEQRQLALKCLTELTEPPATTNHMAFLGQLPGLWKAAQQGLSLRAARSAESPAISAPEIHPEAHASAHLLQHNQLQRRIPVAGVSDSQQCQQEVDTYHHSSCLKPDTPAEEACRGQDGQRALQILNSSNSASRASGTLARNAERADSAQLDSPADSVRFQDSWAEHGAGPPARQLLEKLRWASIGPTYDWTARRYRHDAPQLPLPQSIARLAQRCAQAASEAQHAASMSQGEGSGAGLSKQEGHPEAALEAGKSDLGGSGQRYEPDAALINFYAAGSTLGGHRDDVEADLSQPIVSISLGSDAIFLLGGSSRDAKPTAMMVRSGDAIVLAGPARACYHGMPRIFDEAPPPTAFALQLPSVPETRDGQSQNGLPRRCDEAPPPAAFAIHLPSGSGTRDGQSWYGSSETERADDDWARQSDSEMSAVARFMQGRRINVSVRATL